MADWAKAVGQPRGKLVKKEFLSVLLTGLCGCTLAGCGSSAEPVDPATRFAQQNLIKHPLGRFQLAGKREYTNGTEIYVLDTKTGQVCYYFVASGTSTDPKLADSDSQSCAGNPLDPDD